MPAVTRSRYRMSTPTNESTDSPIDHFFGAVPAIAPSDPTSPLITEPNTLTQAAAPAPSAGTFPPSPAGTFVPFAIKPEFTGLDRSAAGPFVSRFDRVFFGHPLHFPTDVSKVLLLADHLSGLANSWFDNKFAARSPVLHSWTLFRAEFLKTWGPFEAPGVLVERLTSLRQTSSVAAYGVAFTPSRNAPRLRARLWRTDF